jgi:signal peptidase I
MTAGRAERTPRRAVDDDSRPEDVREPPEELSFRGHVFAFIKELTAVVIGAIIVASLLRGFVGQMFLIPSVSMENTLKVNDRVVVEKLSTTKRGEVVVFKDPGGWLTGTKTPERGPIGKALQFVGVLPDTSTEHLIKRAVGLPGDHVVCCDKSGRISVNDHPLDETSYLDVGADNVQAQPSAIPFDVVVPDKHIFVLGDNRDHSRDSRCHLNDPGQFVGGNAFVSEDLVVGRAIAVVWPFDRKHRLQIPATFDSVPPGKLPAPGTPQITAGPEANC